MAHAFWYFFILNTQKSQIYRCWHVDTYNFFHNFLKSKKYILNFGLKANKLPFALFNLKQLHASVRNYQNIVEISWNVKCNLPVTIIWINIFIENLPENKNILKTLAWLVNFNALQVGDSICYILKEINCSIDWRFNLLYTKNFKETFCAWMIALNKHVAALDQPLFLFPNRSGNVESQVSAWGKKLTLTSAFEFYLWILRLIS